MARPEWVWAELPEELIKPPRHKAVTVEEDQKDEETETNTND